MGSDKERPDTGQAAQPAEPVQPPAWARWRNASAHDLTSYEINAYKAFAREKLQQAFWAIRRECGGRLSPWGIVQLCGTVVRELAGNPPAPQ